MGKTIDLKEKNTFRETNQSILIKINVIDEHDLVSKYTLVSIDPISLIIVVM